MEEARELLHLLLTQPITNSGAVVTIVLAVAVLVTSLAILLLPDGSNDT